MASKDITRRPNGDLDPFAPFRAQFDRLFDDFFGSSYLSAFNPAMDVRETETEIVIAADLPGMSDDDISIELSDDMLTIHGERKEETSDDRESRRLYERRYGEFSRAVRLPFTPKPDDVEASFKDGVLKVTIAKPEDAQPATRKIAINH